jgi:hypothetical protein
MAETRASNPLVDQFRKGGVPKELRLMAAQGALPLKPEDLVELLHFLLGDADPDVNSQASAQLLAFPVAELLPIFRDRLTPPAILAWGVAARKEGELREVVLQNVSLGDDAVQAVAPSLPEALAELVVINQVRLLRSTPLLEAIESNPTLNNDQRRRLRELRETFRIGQEPEPPPPPPIELPPASAEPPPPVEEISMEAPKISEAEAVVRYLSEDERRHPEKVSTVQKIYLMNTAEKVIIALKGNREERAILVRDPNRMVATAVLGSPRVTDAEIEGFAAMKNVSDQILRQIGTNKDWVKRYAVISNLVKNPRTPLGVALPLVARLNPRDMKGVTVDRNVPEAIRKAAQRFVKATQAMPGEKKD